MPNQNTKTNKDEQESNKADVSESASASVVSKNKNKQPKQIDGQSNQGGNPGLTLLDAAGTIVSNVGTNNPLLQHYQGMYGIAENTVKLLNNVREAEANAPVPAKVLYAATDLGKDTLTIGTLAKVAKTLFNVGPGFAVSMAVSADAYLEMMSTETAERVVEDIVAIRQDLYKQPNFSFLSSPMAFPPEDSARAIMLLAKGYKNFIKKPTADVIHDIHEDGQKNYREARKRDAERGCVINDSGTRRNLWLKICNKPSSQKDNADNASMNFNFRRVEAEVPAFLRGMIGSRLHGQQEVAQHAFNGTPADPSKHDLGSRLRQLFKSQSDAFQQQRASSAALVTPTLALYRTVSWIVQLPKFVSAQSYTVDVSSIFDFLASAKQSFSASRAILPSQASTETSSFVKQITETKWSQNQTELRFDVRPTYSSTSSSAMPVFNNISIFNQQGQPLLSLTQMWIDRPLAAENERISNSLQQTSTYGCRLENKKLLNNTNSFFRRLHRSKHDSRSFDNSKKPYGSQLRSMNADVRGFTVNLPAPCQLSTLPTIEQNRRLAQPTGLSFTSNFNGSAYASRAPMHGMLLFPNQPCNVGGGRVSQRFGYNPENQISGLGNSSSMFSNFTPSTNTMSW